MIAILHDKTIKKPFKKLGFSYLDAVNKERLDIIGSQDM